LGHFHLSNALGFSRRPLEDKIEQKKNVSSPSPSMAPGPLLGRHSTAPPSRPNAVTLRSTTASGQFAARQPLTTGLSKLASLRDRSVKPAAQPRQLASVDLAGGLSAQSVRVPSMNVSITCDDPRLLDHYGQGRENVVLQRLQMKAFEAIHEASQDVKDAIREFDNANMQRPPASAHEAEERQKTFDAACRSIVSAQQSKIEQVIQREWGMQKQRDTALLASNVRFGVKVTMQAASVSANLGTTALLPNPVNPARAAYSLYRMAHTIQQFAKDREQAAKSIEKGDVALAKLQAGDAAGGGSKHGWRTRAREMVSAVHIPFTQKMFRSVHNQEQKLDEFLAKSARVDKDARAMYEQTNELLATLEKLPEAPPEGRDPHADMRREADELLGCLGDLMQSIEQDHAFYEYHSKRCEAYKASQPVGLSQQADAVDMAATAARVGRFAGNLAKIASHLTP
jgi:hypothetical protein